MELQKIDSNIYKIDSGKEGKRIMILGGVHGFERTGIVLVEKMIEMFQKNEINLLSGLVVLALGNEPAIELNQRWVKPGDDLNRFFSKERLENLSDDSYETVRARRLAEVMRESDVLLDIHSTNTPSRSFLACENEPEHYEIHKWFNADTVITDPDYILSDGFYSTTDEYMNACGGVGVCFETGYGKDVTAVDRVLNNILNIFMDQEMIERGNDFSEDFSERDIYRMYSRIDLTKSGFKYEKGFGKGDFEPVEKDQIIGFHGKKELKSPISGILLLQRPEEMWHIGEPVGYLAERINA